MSLFNVFTSPKEDCIVKLSKQIYDETSLPPFRYLAKIQPWKASALLEILGGKIRSKISDDEDTLSIRSNSDSLTSSCAIFIHP